MLYLERTADKSTRLKRVWRYTWLIGVNIFTLYTHVTYLRALVRLSELLGCVCKIFIDSLNCKQQHKQTPLQHKQALTSILEFFPKAPSG